jgi:single-strand DNA-binding protein
MKYANTHSIRGYVGRDAKTTKFENDRQVTNFSVATKTFWKENGEDKSRTEWHRIVVWGNLSKKVAENLKKGQPVLVEGESRTREYPKQLEAEKKKIDVKASITEIFASTVLVFAEQESNDADQPDEAAPAGADGEDLPF